MTQLWLATRNWPLHDLFFYSTTFFLVGIGLSSIVNLTTSLLTIALLAIVFLFLKKEVFLPFLVMTVIGSVYYFTFDYLQKPLALKSEGIVIETKQKINHQELILDNKIKIITARYPKYKYGDRIMAAGDIKKSKSPFLNGVVSYPKIELLGENQGNIIKAQLLKWRLAFEDNIKRVLPHDKAVFLSGLTVGNVSEISKEFNERLKASGTTHLVALSGYNISIVLNFLGWLGFWPSILLVIAFVVMTGAEASLVRAAIMGIILLVAQRHQRLHSVRNAIIFAALVMVLFDPKILVFDVGFQLSFLAILGMVYLKPALEARFSWPTKKIWGGWLRKNFWITFSAQVAVLPLLVLRFGQFNPFSLLANLLVAEAIPYTMALGFLTGVLGFFSYQLSLAAAWTANILLTYEILVINFFAFSF